MTRDSTIHYGSAQPTGAGGARGGDDVLSRPRRQRPSRSRGVWLFIRDIFVIFLAALLISFLIKTFLLRSFYIPSESMRETLHVDDRIIVNLLQPGLFPVDRGDVVVFRDPGGWLNPMPTVDRPTVAAAIDAFLGFVGLSAPDSEDHLIKRIIGLPGDVVACCDEFGRLTVNGIPLVEPYVLLPDGTTQVTPNEFEVTIPDGMMWVMGDNRYNSADSAFHLANSPGNEFVPIDNVVGKAVLISWPFERWTTLSSYPLIFSGVDDAAPAIPVDPEVPVAPAAPETAVSTE
jgi:signal peptidase I